MPKNIVKTICYHRGRGSTQREKKPPYTPLVKKSYTENENLKIYRERKSESEREPLIFSLFLSLSLSTASSWFDKTRIRVSQLTTPPKWKLLLLLFFFFFFNNCFKFWVIKVLIMRILVCFGYILYSVCVWCCEFY
jgi:hypothetical protein